MIDYRSMTKEEGQARLQAHVEKTIHQNNIEQADRINGLMRCAAGRGSYEDQSITFEFPVDRWQTNRVGKLHGGIICTAFDLTIAALARFFAGENFAPTVSMNVSFHRPVEEGDVLVVTARAVSVGRRLTHLRAEAHSGSTGKLAASATSVYINVDTEKEHRSDTK